MARLLSAALVFAAALLSGQTFPAGNAKPPAVISRVDPSYTPEASAARLEGTVTLSIVVGTDGMAHDINVVKGLGSGLDEQAVLAVQKWHFRPAEKDGEPVSTRAQIQVNFRLLQK